MKQLIHLWITIVKVLSSRPLPVPIRVRPPKGSHNWTRAHPNPRFLLLRIVVVGRATKRAWGLQYFQTSEWWKFFGAAWGWCVAAKVERLPCSRKAFQNTVKPLLSGQPLLRGQLSKSRNCSQYNTVNKTSFLAATFIKRPRPPFGRPDRASPIVFTSI